MILVDLNQVLLSGLMSQINNQKNVKLEEDLIRHMILNILRTHVRNFRNQYGEVVLCCDNRKYWRKEYFPFYKASRKKARDKSDLDWHLIFDMLAKFKMELKEYFPYKVIDVDGAEADDIIGTLAPRYISHQNILILSSDGDFLQLQRYNNTNGNTLKQYNPSLKKYIVSENPVRDLKEKIIRGDKGDGIPNIFSPADCFVREIRQKPISKKSLDNLISEDLNNHENDYVRSGFIRNEKLIDLSHTPTDIKEKIINSYENTKPANKNSLLNYFIQNKLKNLIDCIEDF